MWNPSRKIIKVGWSKLACQQPSPFLNESVWKIPCSELAGVRVKCQEQKYSGAISGVMNQVENHACQQCRHAASPVDGGVRSHLKGKQFAGILPVKSCLDISCHYEHNVLDYRMNSSGVHVKMSTDLQLAEVNMSICGPNHRAATTFLGPERDKTFFFFFKPSITFATRSWWVLVRCLEEIFVDPSHPTRENGDWLKWVGHWVGCRLDVSLLSTRLFTKLQLLTF